MKTKKIILASSFFAFCCIAVLLQIPVYSFLTIEFSLVFLLIANRFVGFKYSILIAILYPWFAMVSYIPADIVGVSTLIVLNLLVIFFDTFFIQNKKLMKNNYIKIFLSIFLISVIMTFLNLILFIPAYYGFDYSLITQDGILWYTLYIIIVFIPFNIIKLTIMYLISLVLIKQIIQYKRGL